MDYSTCFLLLSFLLTVFYALTLLSRHNSRLPPGPYPFPIIGNLLKLGHNPHHSLASLSKRYGPLMSLKLGSKTTIVVSSPDIAKEFFQTHDQSFSSRSVPEAARVVDHHKFSLVWLPAGDQWRRLRRITKEYMFSVQCLDASELLRKEKVTELIDHVDQCCKKGKAVNVGAAAFTTILNIFSNFIFSTDFARHDSVSSQDFKDTVWALMEVGGKPNVVDYFPILKPFDPQRLLGWVYVCGKKLLNIFDEIIDQRLERRSNISLLYDGVSSTKNDVLESLLNLNLKDESEFSRNDMRHLILDLFMAGTDTISSTVEWAMTELIRNRDKMETARMKLTKFIQNDKSISERDISQLPYLQAIIKETLRLHPPAPFLIPHQAVHDIEVQGSIVPKNAQVLCNVWAMGRDPDVWTDPERFMPERFLDVEIEYKGQNFELIPFGAGRRICPGLNFAHKMLHIVLGSLIHNFDWQLEENIRAQDVDMGEKFGLTLQKNVPLMAIPIKL
ncbi:cytochrome P450 76T24-like [Rutidosis leptorrhynchoides]|uniref:cytochrome P450 76T24-like n=1 Tax=Rutidosis leptorrhynchoides TaxID=125765 RepID=UPI003A997A47